MQSVPLISNSPCFFLSQSISRRTAWLIWYQKKLSSWCLWTISAPGLSCTIVQQSVSHLSHQICHLASHLSSYSVFSPWIPQVTKSVTTPCIWTGRHYTDTPPVIPQSEDVSPYACTYGQYFCHLALCLCYQSCHLPSKFVLVHLHTTYVSTHCISHFILPLQSAFHVFTPSDIHHGFSIRNSSGN